MTSQTEDIDPAVARNVRAAVKKSLASQGGFVEEADLQQQAWVWVYENQDKIDEWQEAGNMGYLANALFYALHRFTMQERYEKDGTEPGDYARYSPETIDMFLGSIFSNDPPYDSFSALSPDVSGRNSRSPAEGNERLAMVADIKAGLARLTKEEYALVKCKYADGGRSDADVGREMDMAASTAAGALSRAVRKVGKFLGSEPVRVKRRVMSNATAIHIVEAQ